MQLHSSYRLRETRMVEMGAASRRWHKMHKTFLICSAIISSCSPPDHPSEDIKMAHAEIRWRGDRFSRSAALALITTKELLRAVFVRMKKSKFSVAAVASRCQINNARDEDIDFQLSTSPW
jgi:hypothetical protein